MRAHILCGAVLVFLCSIIALSYCANSTSVVWDEPIYIQHSDSIRSWFSKGAPIDPISIQSAWAYDKFGNPHPPFMKLASALGAEVSSGLFSFPLNYRIGHCLFSALILTTIFILIAGGFGCFQALIAIAFITYQPRLFGELYVATTDGPVALGWILLSVLSWKISLNPDKNKLIAYWSIFYLTFAAISSTKLTGFLSIIPIVSFFIWRRNYKAIGLAIGAAVLACLLIIALTPEHWGSPTTALKEYFFYLAKRKKEFLVHVFYLGNLHGEYLPWHYFPVLSLITLPLPHLFFSAVILFGKKMETIDKKLFIAILPAIVFWLIIGITPFSPKHDGVRQFLPFFPFIGIVAWLGLRVLMREVTTGRLLVLAVATGSIMINKKELQNFPRTYYNSLIGGLAGAEEAGLEILYWLEILTPEMQDWINKNTSPGDTIAILPPWVPLLKIHQQRGLLKSDLVIIENNFHEAKYLLVANARNEIRRDFYKNLTPVWEIRKEGVSLAKVVKQH